MLEFSIFETAIGACALVWRDQGIVGSFLPEDRSDRLRMRLRRKFPSALESEPIATHRVVIERIGAHLAGAPDDLADIALDESGIDPFDRAVYRITRAIPVGETLTYGEVAARLGQKDKAREVGQALARNRFPIIIPCHRVLAAGSRIGGFSAPGGIATKRRLLALENAMNTGRRMDAQLRLI